MINAQKTARRREAAPDATITLRWDEERKRWEVTLSHRTQGLLGAILVDTTAPLDRVTATLLLAHLRDAFEGVLPF